MMSLPVKVNFIVSANSKIGYGHLKRCLLIAKEFFVENVLSTFFVFDNDKTIKNIIEKEGFNFEVIDDIYDPKSYTQRLSKSYENLIVIDSDDRKLYEENFQKTIIAQGFKLMYITLYADVHYYSHFILNPNIISLSQEYSTEFYTQKFLGPQYFILDDNFSKIKPNILVKQNKISLLITFGSADPANNTQKILDILENKMDLFSKVRIILGGLNPNIEKIKSHSLIRKYPAIFDIHVNTTQMYDLMSKTDLALTSLGLTFWELLLHKIPCLVISGSEREKNLLKYFREKEYCYYIGDYDDENWKENWGDHLNFSLKTDGFTKPSIEKLYNSVNANGKKKLINEILNGYE